MAWHAKEVVRSAYDHTDPDLALEFVTRLGRDLQDSTCPPEVCQLGRTIRGHKDDPLYRSRRLLTKADERLDTKGRAKLVGLLEAGDPPPSGGPRSPPGTRPTSPTTRPRPRTT